MEQIKQLIEILSQTPQMALWGLGLYFLWTLLKMASVITALAMIARYWLTRFFDFQESKLTSERINEIRGHADLEQLRRLIHSITNGEPLFGSEVEKAIKKIKYSDRKDAEIQSMREALRKQSCE